MSEAPRWDVRIFPVVASTNETVRELAVAGAPGGTVVVADEQTAGRGRHGRSWSSPAGAGFYGSLLLRPELEARQVQALTFVAALAVAEMLGELGVTNVELKWPNDVLVNGRKICGILCEAAFVEQRVAWAVVGIGVNLTNDAVPTAPLVSATSLAEVGARASSVDVLGPLLEAFGRWYVALLEDGPPGVLERWASLAPSATGAEVTVDDGRESYPATTDGLTADGHLRVRRPDGSFVELSAADVTLGRR